MERERAPRNRTLRVSAEDYGLLAGRLLRLGAGAAKAAPLPLESVLDRTIQGDFFEVAGRLPRAFADLLLVDPPYNLRKDFNGRTFRERGEAAYRDYVASWLDLALPLLKPDASLYVCCDWRSSAAVSEALGSRAIIRNRITWQREKGRGAAANWKNCLEDIWFATLGEDYYFDVEAVKQRRRVLAPYSEGGKPKGWEESAEGRFRLTAPSNFWDDISVPYWSMPENTDHPTQKPEKLVAKLVLASSRPGAIVLDPFLGSGTSSVVARKLGRHYVGVELDEEYCVWAESRLSLAAEGGRIQGYEDGVFWERNTAAGQARRPKGKP